MTLREASAADSRCWFHAHTCGLLLAMAGAISGCPDDGEESATNVLPTQGASESSTATDPTATMTMTTTAETSVDVTGDPVDFPTAYRFECIDIQVLGDADGTAFQANLLEDTWNDDIDDYKLDIIFEVVTRDDAAGTAQVAIRSGIGTNPTDLCSEPTSETAAIDVGYDAASALWVPSSEEGACSAAAAGGEASGGSYTMMLGAEMLVYIYAQDTDGTTFNCTADAAVPDAVPVRAVEAELTVSSDGSTVAGTLTGCLLGTEAQALCSCLGQCNPKLMNENCGGCPDGSVPLRDLLSGINPSTRCSDLTGAEAYDITLGFTANVLPAVPMTCEAG